LGEQRNANSSNIVVVCAEPADARTLFGYRKNGFPNRAVISWRLSLSAVSNGGVGDSRSS
jgi:hypothetical protein